MFFEIVLDMADILKKSILGLIRHLGWFGMVQNTPTGCGNDIQTLFKNQDFKNSGSVCPRICFVRSFLNVDFLVCLDQSATTKMTAWTMRSFHGFDLKAHLLRETLPNKSPRWISHFSSCLVICFLCN